MGIRTFIAIEISNELRRELFSLQEELKRAKADVKWVKPGNMHLTLKFLGDTDEKEIEKIKEVLTEIFQKKHSFDLNFSGIGAFPKLDFPRVLWAGIEKGKRQLLALSAEIEIALTKSGFPREKRPFNAHLTLGRVRSPKNKDKLKEIIEKRSEFSSKNTMTLKRIIFFKSRLTPQGPIYTALGKYELRLK